MLLPQTHLAPYRYAWEGSFCHDEKAELNIGKLLVVVGKGFLYCARGWFRTGLAHFSIRPTALVPFRSQFAWAAPTRLVKQLCFAESAYSACSKSSPHCLFVHVWQGWQGLLRWIAEKHCSPLRPIAPPITDLYHSDLRPAGLSQDRPFMHPTCLHCCRRSRRRATSCMCSRQTSRLGCGTAL